MVIVVIKTFHQSRKSGLGTRYGSEVVADGALLGSTNTVNVMAIDISRQWVGGCSVGQESLYLHTYSHTARYVSQCNRTGLLKRRELP